MFRLLVLIAIALAGVWWLTRSRPRQGPDPSAPPRTPSTQVPGAEPILACAHCGIHLPRSEALMDATGHPYCGEAHRLAGPR